MVLNCVLLYVFVVLLSLVQSRFRIVKDNPWLFAILVIVVPVIGYVKIMSRHRDYSAIEVTGLEILFWVIMVAYMGAKHIVPRIHEGYIFAYTLFHWYLLFDTAALKGWNSLLLIVAVISVFPTLLMFLHVCIKRVPGRLEKMTLYYWFLFTIVFTYSDQVLLDIVHPIAAFRQTDMLVIAYLLLSAVQLYFIAMMLSLLFLGMPFTHFDRGGSRRERRRSGYKEWNELLEHKLDHFIDYQVSIVGILAIIVVSGILFWLDRQYELRSMLIFVYTVALPLVFFYLRYSSDSKNG